MRPSVVWVVWVMAVCADACAPAAASVVMALGTGSARSSSAPVSRCFTVLLVFDGALDRVGSKPDPVGEVFSMCSQARTHSDPIDFGVRLKNLEREFRDAHRDEVQVIAHLRAPLSAAQPVGLAGAESPIATGGRHGTGSRCIPALHVGRDAEDVGPQVVARHRAACGGLNCQTVRGGDSLP